jgi:diacylglycerol kinase (ATP)
VRAAAILGLGTSPRDLRPFQSAGDCEWIVEVPGKPDEADAILIFGGDGTIHRHLPALVHLQLPVLVVPSGSGNDFARALGLRRAADSLLAWRAFLAGRARVRPIDVGCITPIVPRAASHYFACVGGVGLDADIARRANGLPRWLRKAGGYALSLPPSLFAFVPLRLRVWESQDASAAEADLAGAGLIRPYHQTNVPRIFPETVQTASFPGFRLRSDFLTMLAAFANAPFYGDGMKIAPDAQLEDGLFDVCLIEGIDKFKLFRLFPTVYSGGHLGVKEVHSFRTRRVILETEAPVDIYADGEYVCKTPAELRVEAKALRVVVSE